MRQLNLKHIVTNFLGFWLCAFGFQTLAHLRNVELSELIRNSTAVEEDLRRNQYFTTISVTDLAIGVSVGFTIGLLFAFILAIVISVKRDWFWLNSVIALFSFFAFNYFHLLGWNYLKVVFLMPGSWTTGTFYYLTNGLLLITLGVFTLFLKKPLNPNNKSNNQIEPHFA